MLMFMMEVRKNYLKMNKEKSDTHLNYWLKNSTYRRK